MSKQSYRDTASGNTTQTATNVYGYAYQIPAGKTLKSIALPNHTNNLGILGIAMRCGLSPSEPFHAEASEPLGQVILAFPRGGSPPAGLRPESRIARAGVGPGRGAARPWRVHRPKDSPRRRPPRRRVGAAGVRMAAWPGAAGGPAPWVARS